MKTFPTISFLFLFFIPFVSAQFVYGDNLSDEDFDEKISTIQPPIAALQPTLSEYTVNAKKGKTISAGVDTKIIIPPNAFVGRNGNVITGEVDIQYREFKNPLDIFLSGIPMTIEENGKKEFFQSAGMVEFRANQNGEEIFPNPDGEPIIIEISSSQTDKDFNLYTLDESSGEWNEEGKNAVVLNFTEINPLLIQPIPPLKEIARPRIVKLNRKSTRWLKKKKQFLQFTIEDKQRFKTIFRGQNFHGKHFSELKSKKPPIWVYSGKDKKSSSKLLSKLRRANDTWKEDIDSLEHYIVEDIQITPNFKNDNYKISFHCRMNKTWVIEAYPYLSNNVNTEQKRNKAFYKKYYSAYQERCEQWKKIDQRFEDAVVQFEKDSLDFQTALADDDKTKSRRRIGVVTFGVLNIDRVFKRLNEERPLVFKFENNEEVKVSKVYVLDKTNNALLSYDEGQKIRFDNRAKNSLIIALDDASFATISEAEFKSVFKDTTEDEIFFTLKNIHLEMLTKKILSDALAIN